MDSNHKMLAAAAFLLFVMGVTYYFKNQNPNLSVTPRPQTPVVNIPTPTSSPNVFTFALIPQSNSQISGTVTIRELGGKAVVSLDLTNAPADVSMPAHVHVGSCPEPGLVKYPLLNPNSLGRSDTTLDISLKDLRSQLPLAVNIHKSQQEPKVYVSCTNLSF